MREDALRVKQTGLIGKYFPWKMIFVFSAFMAFCVYVREELEVRFMAHPELNALIIGTMFIGIFMVFHNIAKIRFAAMFLEKLEKFEDNPSEEAALKIIKKLRKKARLIDTFYMEGSVLAITEPGHMHFTDNQSRIMKSKVGQRATRMRNSVAFIAALLVMMGLIGTFWGLLETITSVGEAMNAIVDSFDTPDDGSAGEGSGSMVDFLRAISKPLQGMGVAFSASLFGLTGSLINNLLNSFCGKGMDRFLEDFSNWIDARIPTKEEMDAAAAANKKADKPEETSNQIVLNSMQDGFEHFGKQTQHLFAMLSELVGELNELSTEQGKLTRQLTAEKRETARLATSFENGIQALTTHFSSMSDALISLPTITKEIRNDMHGITQNVSSTQQAIVNHQQLTADQIAETSRQQALLNNNLNSLFEGNRALSQVHDRIADSLEALRDDTVSQKDKMIEMVLVMQHLLQSQLEMPTDKIQQRIATSNDAAGEGNS